MITQNVGTVKRPENPTYTKEAALGRMHPAEELVTRHSERSAAE
jgi:hypothetical protein